MTRASGGRIVQYLYRAPARGARPPVNFSVPSPRFWRRERSAKKAGGPQTRRHSRGRPDVFGFVAFAPYWPARSGADLARQLAVNDLSPTKAVSVATFTDPGVTSPFDAASNPSKAAAYWLRRDIVRGVFQPLDRLKVEYLVGFYQVGHSPIREAILLLSSTGLVVHVHQKGYRVAPVSLADYDDILSVYQRLYKLALTMAMELGDEAWEERVVVQLHRSSKAGRVMPDDDPQLS